HVRVRDGVEAGDRGAVEAHTAVEGVVELGDVDGEGLELPEDVREPEADEADAPLLDDRLDVVGGQGLVGHGNPPFGARVMGPGDASGGPRLAGRRGRAVAGPRLVRGRGPTPRPPLQRGGGRFWPAA